MKKLIILMVLAVMLAGCQGYLEKDEAGMSPALKTVGELRQANAVSAPINPYAPWIEIVLGIATVALGGSYVAKRKELGIVGKKYAAHKSAIHEISNTMTAENQAILYETIGKLRKEQGL